jgi:hypothetical protein
MPYYWCPLRFVGVVMGLVAWWLMRRWWRKAGARGFEVEVRE